MRTPVVLSILCVAGASSALPNPDARFRGGANHHEGDDSFVAKFGRTPDDTRDSEKLRMRTHLEHIRQKLAARAATSPDLEKRRAEILGYLDDYIAKGITPQNEHLPWRAPVFIDDHGAICAVGYLIERDIASAGGDGRALPEKIAREHRYEFLEDIAKAMPDVRAWVASSGFTLDELASIQPAYSSPNIDSWRTWDLANHAPKDGEFDDKRVAGTFKNKTLHGTWTVKDEREGDVIVGRGELVRGNGTWTSYYKDGKTRLASGPYRNSKANGDWTFYHPSGNVAAKGKLVGGMRRGEWSFYYDTKQQTPIAIGTFRANGAVTGVWRHFDAKGKLLARTYSQKGDVTDITPDAAGVREQSHAFMDPPGPVDGYPQRLTRLALGSERIYIHDSGFADTDTIYDAAGFRLEKDGGKWTAADCNWSGLRKRVAGGDDVPWLHRMLFADSHKRAVTKTEYGYPHIEKDPGPKCGTPKPVSTARAKQLDTLMASREKVRAPNPAFIREIVLQQEPDALLLPDAGDKTKVTDDTKIEPDFESGAMASQSGSPLTKTAAWKNDLRAFVSMATIENSIHLVEWPHIDGRFDRVFRTLAGHYRWQWAGSEPEADGSQPDDKGRRRRREER
jgi:hypothetical protein